MVYGVINVYQLANLSFMTHKISLRSLLYTILFVCSYLGMTAQKVIEYEGNKYDISSRTVVLDREGILNYPGAFKEAAEAFNKVNSIGHDVTLLIAPSVYWLDDPDDSTVRSEKGGTPYAVRIHCESLNMIGLSKNPEDVIFAVNRGQTQGAVGNLSMFHFSGKSLTAQILPLAIIVMSILPTNAILNSTERNVRML